MKNLLYGVITLLAAWSCQSKVLVGTEAHQGRNQLTKNESTRTAETIRATTGEVQEDEPATLYFYRPPVLIGDMMQFDIYLDDDLLCRSEPNWGEKVIVPQTGKSKLWTDTERKFSMTVRLEPGKDYYIQCSVSFGIVRSGKPVLKIVDKEKGRAAYDKIVGQVLTLENPDNRSATSFRWF